MRSITMQRQSAGSEPLAFFSFTCRGSISHKAWFNVKSTTANSPGRISTSAATSRHSVASFIGSYTPSSRTPSVIVVPISRPERSIRGSRSTGIFLTTSGDETREYPIAARAALRFLGETPMDAVQNSVMDLTQAEGEPEHLLRSRVGDYLSDLEKDRLLRPDVLKWVA